MRHFFRRKNKKRAPVSAQTQLIRKQVIIGIALAALIGGLIALTWYVTRLSSLQVNDIKVVGGITIPHSEIENLAYDALSGTHARLIPKRFVWTFPQEFIREQVLAIDRVKNIRLELDDDNNLVIAFEEYRPLALWCSSLESNDCVFIDAFGLAFAAAPDLNGGAFVRYVTDEGPVVKQYIADKSFLTETEKFIEKIESELSLFVTHVLKIGDFDIEYYVSGGGRIKVSQDMSMEKSFNNLKLILDSDEFDHLEPGDFNYIDLRFGDKIFVSEVTEETGLVASTSEAISTSISD